VKQNKLEQKFETVPALHEQDAVTLKVSAKGLRDAKKGRMVSMAQVRKPNWTGNSAPRKDR
jgi:ribosomal protein L28